MYVCACVRACVRARAVQGQLRAERVAQLVDVEAVQRILAGVQVAVLKADHAARPGRGPRVKR
eukprot:1928127-Lingulodinium_polyedra.AAC.1